MKTLLNGLMAVCLSVQSILGAFPSIRAVNNIDSQINTLEMQQASEKVSLLSDDLAIEVQADQDTVPTRLNIIADPQLIIPGAPITINWTIDGWEAAQKKENLKALFQFPNDVVSNETSARTIPGNDYSTMDLPVQAAIGTTTFTAQENTKAPFLVDVTLMSIDERLASNSVLLTEPSLEAIAGKDNHLVSKDGKVALDFPAKGLTESLYLDVRDPSPSSIAGYSLSGRPVEVVAVGETSKKNIYKFDNDFTISLTYDPANIYGGGAEDDLTIFYFDAETNDWWPVQTQVDKANHKLTAQVNHLTVFDYRANSWQGASIPSIDQAQVSGNTGAAIYDMSFWLPPAQGGFGPSLSLSYNSQIIDSSTAFTQAGWVGAGWSLDTGYIERNMHGTNEDLSDDTYQLILGGVSNTLLPIATNGTVTTYATREMNYWSIKYDSSTKVWTIKDNAGTTYVFGHATTTNATNACVTNSTDLNLIWRWSLTTATDRFNSSVTYSYTTQKKTSSSTCLNQVAVYPVSITYPNGHYRIDFILEARTDFQSSWEANDSKMFFQSQRLDKIQIVHNPSGTTWNTIRQYDFTYSNSTANQIYPDFTWTKGARTSALVGVQEINGAGSANLPATQFTYEDKMHLTKVDNGQGGSVTYTYERWTYLDDANDDLWSLYTEFGNHECSDTIGTAWYAMTGYGTTKCEQYMLQIDKRDTSIGVGLRAFPQNIIKPGAQYRLYIQARNIYTTTGLEWGFTDPNNSRDIEGIVNGIGTTLTDFEVGGEMAVNLDPLTTKFIIECDNCYIKKLQFMMMPLFYRVTSKTITDSATSSNSTFTYSYNDGAVNDTAHSESQNQTGDKYTPVMREYRGFAQVQINNPDGLVTSTWYHQVDQLFGRPYRTLTSTRDVYDEFLTLDTTKWNFSHAGVRQTIAANQLQESWLKSTSTTADWSTVTNRAANSLSDGDFFYSQFQISGANTQALLGVEQSNGDYFGLYSVPNGASHDLKTRVKVNGTPTDTLLMPAGTFKRDTWYVMMIFVDVNDGFHLRAWEKYTPSSYVEFATNIFTAPLNWRFTEKVYNGTVVLDSYLEGVPYSEAETTYTSSVLYDTLTNNIPNLAGLTNFVDLQVAWSTTSSTISRQFDRDYSFSATKASYEYNTADQGGVQYGNLTRTWESSWNGSTWEDYRGQKTNYIPNATNYLTRLPSRQVTLACSGSCNFATETGKQTERLLLYDGSASATTPPSAGHLTGERTWVQNADYAQVSYHYDTFGNQDVFTRYTGYATATTHPTAVSQSTTTIYEATYHTYPTEVRNAYNQSTLSGYDYALGLPTSITDANGLTTGATYDSFGRMTRIIAPGDSVNSPTLSITYWDNRIPFQVDLVQKVNNAGASIRITRFYDGLGQLIQTQTVGAVNFGVQQNVVVDTDFDALGRATRQTKPYAITYNAAPTFQAQAFTQPKTTTGYDMLSRPLTVAEPNGNTASYSYNDLVTYATDPGQNTTATTKDVWGRTVSVDAPTGPDMAYQYDVHDQLTRVQKGAGVPIIIAYDGAGQKRTMDDPDMGDWAYDYDGAGNLRTQTDARSCQTTLAYDPLNRLESKTFSGPGACDTTPDIIYFYDNYDDFPSYTPVQDHPVGRRTGMTDGTGRTIWEYDARGRATREDKTISGQNFVTGWSYNSADQVETMTYPDGEVLTYEPNTSGDLRSLKNAQNYYYVSETWYDEAGRIRQLNRGGVLGGTYTYYPWSDATIGGQLFTAVTTNVQSVTLQNLGYTYDSRGNRVIVNDAVGNEVAVFSYDALSRLETMTVHSSSINGPVTHSEAFDYSATTGNLSGKGPDENSLTPYTYDPVHPHAVSAFGVNSYTYDSNGNQTHRQIGANDLELTYDAENRLVSVNGDIVVAPTATPTVTPTASATPTSTATLPPTATSTPAQSNTPTLTPTHTATHTATPTLPPTATATLQTGSMLTFAPLDDATIQSASPDTNAGSATSMVVDNSPVQNFLIKFQVDGLAGRTVTRATLKLYNVSSSDIGGAFYRVIDQTWEEETVTWNNAPAHDNTLVASLGAVTNGNWYSVDLTTLISADGTYSLRVSSTSSDGADYRSKEGANPPVLEVEVAGGPTATPGPTATASETPTATLSPTATLTATPTLTPQATATAQTGSTLTFAPLDDSYVHNGYPSTNYGAAAGLLVDNSPVEHILIKFQVDGLAGRTVTQATLRLYNTNESSIGGKFYRVNDQSWTEETVTWNNAPAADATEIASLGAVAIGNWYAVDLTSLITADGTYSLRVTSTSTNGADYSSKEGANPPVLELVVADSATATPGSTATATMTATHTATATHTLTATPTATATPQTYQMTYTYDGDGNLVKSVLGDVVTYYVGKHYEKRVDGITEKVFKYYFAGANRIAMRENGTLTWLISDHLGSTSVTTDASGNQVSSLRYTAFGEVRAAGGTTTTDYRYTGQRSEDEIGLCYYVARWYDPALGRFVSADSIVPEPYNPLDWDRYQYVRSNPIRYIDPSGHMIACSSDSGNGCAGTGLGNLPPARIVKAGATFEQEVRAIYNYSVTHPDYNYTQDSNLEATEKFVVSNAIFLGAADSVSRKPTIADRIQSSGDSLAAGISLSVAAIIAGGDMDIDGNQMPSISSRGGRLGGRQHQAAVNDIRFNVEDTWGSGYYTDTEIYFLTTGGLKSRRFADVGVYDPNDHLIAVYQVGVGTQGGLPIARERQAITDIVEYGLFEGPIIFFPYK